MSSYLTFYGVIPESKPIRIASFSRNNDIYQAFHENASIAYIGNDDEPKYSDITEDVINGVVNSLKDDINKAEKRLNEYEKHVKDDSELINDILSMKEYIEDLQIALYKISFLSDMIFEIKYGYSDFTKIIANVD